MARTDYRVLLSEKSFLKVKLRAMRLTGSFIDEIFYNKRDILFRTRSGTDPRLTWYQTFRLMDLINVDFESFDFRQLDNLIRNTQLKIHCSCVREDTDIRTPRGLVKLKDLKKGDYVITGWNTNAIIGGILESSSELAEQKYEIGTEDGKILRLLASHKVMTDKGLVRVDKLNYRSYLATLPDVLIPITNRSDSLTEYKRVNRIRKIDDDMRYLDIALFDEPHTYIANNYIVSNCPAFLYWGFKYKAWKYGYGLEKELRRPTIRNPQLRGYVCKHLYQCAQVFPFLSKELAKKFRDQFQPDEKWQKKNAETEESVDEQNQEVGDSYERRDSGLIVPKRRIIKVFGTRPNYPDKW